MKVGLPKRQPWLQQETLRTECRGLRQCYRLGGHNGNTFWFFSLLWTFLEPLLPFCCEIFLFSLFLPFDSGTLSILMWLLCDPIEVQNLIKMQKKEFFVSPVLSNPWKSFSPATHGSAST